MSDLIDRQAAIDAICKACAYDSDYVDCQERRPESTFCDYIVALRQLPCAQPEIKCIANITMTDEQVQEAFKRAKTDILSAQPQTGSWIQSSPFTKPRCSECGEPCFGLHGFDYTVTKYCPNCGAKMQLSDKGTTL